MKASQQAIERGVKDCVFIDYKRRSGHFDVTTVASIKEIIEKVKLFTLCVISVLEQQSFVWQLNCSLSVYLRPCHGG